MQTRPGRLREVVQRVRTALLPLAQQPGPLAAERLRMGGKAPLVAWGVSGAQRMEAAGWWRRERGALGRTAAASKLTAAGAASSIL